jgi:hypothetical protein
MQDPTRFKPLSAVYALHTGSGLLSCAVLAAVPLLQQLRGAAGTQQPAKLLGWLAGAPIFSYVGIDL